MTVKQWNDKVAVVSGASSGIGAAVARALSKEGLRVAIGARRTDRLEALAAELAPAPVWAHALDVRDRASINTFYDALDRHWGRIDVLVNNAGVGFRGDLWDQDPAQWSAMLDVNVLGLLSMTQLALQRMRASGDAGHIFHISSMAGHRVPGRTAVYAATKHAVKALTEGLRFDLRSVGSQIRVTAVSPGFVETDFLEPYVGDAGEAQRLKQSLPMLTSSDVASAVVYALAAPAHMQVHDILIRPTDQQN